MSKLLLPIQQVPSLYPMGLVIWRPLDLLYQPKLVRPYCSEGAIGGHVYVHASGRMLNEPQVNPGNPDSDRRASGYLTLLGRGVWDLPDDWVGLRLEGINLEKKYLHVRPVCGSLQAFSDWVRGGGFGELPGVIAPDTPRMQVLLDAEKGRAEVEFWQGVKSSY